MASVPDGELVAVFFFKAKGGIRDWSVTGVQTCAFFFSSRRRHTRLVSDWSSDVCSSDLPVHRDEGRLLRCHLDPARSRLAQEDPELVERQAVALLGLDQAVLRGQLAAPRAQYLELARAADAEKGLGLLASEHEALKVAALVQGGLLLLHEVVEAAGDVDRESLAEELEVADGVDQAALGLRQPLVRDLAPRAA